MADKLKKKFFLTKSEIILIIVVFAFIAVFIFNSEEIGEIFKILRKGKWYFIILAAIMQIFDYYVFTWLYYYCFKLVHVKSSIKELFPLTFASVFANLVPSGGTSGAAIFIHDAVTRKESGAKATVGALLVQLFDFTAFLVILGIGLTYLLSQGTLKTYQIVASAIMILAIGIVSTLLTVSLWQFALMEKFLNKVERFINRISFKIRKRQALSIGWSMRVSIDLQDAAQAIVTHPKKVLLTFFIGLGNHVFDILTVLCIFLAFNQEVRFGTIVTGYAMTHLFTTVALTPQGIGVVESIMVFMYSSLGVPFSSATIISLAYRGLKLWMPLFIGFLILRKLRMFNGKHTEE